MELTVPERLKLLELIPEKDNFAGITEMYRAGLLLSLTDEEKELIEVKLVDGGVQWNQEKALTLVVDVPMGEYLTNVIRGVLREKDKDHDLDISELSLYEKLIMDYE